MRPHRLIALLLTVILIGAALSVSACTGGSSDVPGKFLLYETRATGQTRSDVQPLIEPGDKFDTPVREQTGLALVQLADGTQVKAECPIQGLTEGTDVMVRRSAEGRYVVLGTP